MSTELVLQDTTSEQWEELLDQFAKDTASRLRDFRLPVELIIEAVNGERWVMPAGTKVHVFAFVTGEGATRQVFRTEGTFFLRDRVVSICGTYKYVKPGTTSPQKKKKKPASPKKAPVQRTRMVRITEYGSNSSLAMRSGWMPLNLI